MRGTRGGDRRPLGDAAATQGVSERSLSEQAADAFATTAKRLREAGISAEATSHLLTQCRTAYADQALPRTSRLLAQAHQALGGAVAGAYGWADYTPQMADEEILRRLLVLNRERAASGTASKSMLATAAPGC